MEFLLVYFKDLKMSSLMFYLTEFHWDEEMELYCNLQLDITLALLKDLKLVILMLTFMESKCNNNMECIM